MCLFNYEYKTIIAIGPDLDIFQTLCSIAIKKVLPAPGWVGAIKILILVYIMQVLVLSLTYRPHRHILVASPGVTGELLVHWKPLDFTAWWRHYSLNAQANSSVWFGTYPILWGSCTLKSSMWGKAD